MQHARSRRGTGMALCVVLIAGAVQAAAPAGRVVASSAPGWPQFRGPTRNGISNETGLLQAWPAGGPKRVWTQENIGRGYSSPIITGGRIYVTGDTDEGLAVFAFDLDGKLQWKTTNGRSWARPHPGARASCTYDEGRLYHMNAHGRAVCLDAADGREIWAVNVLRRFSTRNVTWGIAECLLIDGDRVIVSPGGGKTLMAALDKKTGKTVWRSGPLRFLRTVRFGGHKVDPPAPDADKAGYASPILFERNGRRLIAGCSARHLYCVDADTGKRLWEIEVTARYEVIGSIPIFWKDSVFFTVPDVYGGRFFRVHASADAVRFEKRWETPVDACSGALVIVDGRLYGSGYRRHDRWVCIDTRTGEMLASKDDRVKGTVVYADGRLYALSESGEMALLKPTDEGFETVGRFKLTARTRKDAWAHPSIAGGRLYLRYHERLHCYDIRRP